MSRKTQECYEHLFHFISSNICSLQCSTVITDFERALRNAIEHCLPGVSMFTCWFHFCQACERRCRQLDDFPRVLKRNIEALTLYHKFLCLPLLPPGKIIEAFEMLVVNSIQFGTLFNRFIEYYGHWWIERVGVFTLFYLLILLNF